jgi:DNA-binding PadR family transcriptional regulator
MSEKPASFRNLWALTVLCLLRQGPMHPYEMQRLIRERRKDKFLDLKRGSLYHAIGRLRAAGLIEAVATLRDGRRPERTVYRLTGAGRDELVTWLRELLAIPVHEPSQFFAAVSLIVYLPPKDVLKELSERAGRLEAEIAGLDASLRELVPRIGRLVVLETEYTRAMRQAELAWVRSLIAELQARSLWWEPEELLRMVAEAAAAREMPAGESTDEAIARR